MLCCDGVYKPTAPGWWCAPVLPELSTILSPPIIPDAFMWLCVPFGFWYDLLLSWRFVVVVDDEDAAF